jgi:hypothetical protein
MDMRQLLEQHDRARQLLLEGESLAGLEHHVAECGVCRPLAAKLARLDRLIAEVPGPRPGLLQRILRPRRDPASGDAASGRIEMLWPTGVHERTADSDPPLLPLVLAVETDRYQPHISRQRRMERLVIVGRHPIMIGRGPDVDVPVWDRSVSRRHAQIDWRGGGWIIRDLESTNGTQVNGARLATSEITYLAPGDQIEIGRYAEMTVRSMLPALDPSGVGREIHRLLAWATRTPHGGARREDPHSEQLRARLVGLREETVQLRDQLSRLADPAAEADAFPKVYERLSNMLALIEREGPPAAPSRSRRA